MTPSNPPSLIAPQKLYDNAFADYTAGQYDLAVIGFETFIKTSPRSELVDDAQPWDRRLFAAFAEQCARVEAREAGSGKREARVAR